LSLTLPLVHNTTEDFSFHFRAAMMATTTFTDV
jgi:hypothetical protein